MTISEQIIADLREVVSTTRNDGDRASMNAAERLVFRVLPSLLDEVEQHRAGGSKVAELASECRSLRERLKDRNATPWLVKDFWALYSAASAVTTPAALAGAEDSIAWLELQLARLRPAFEVCESERRGAPDRLTPAERYALTGLHRWLHSPGDATLVEDAAGYHEQIGADSSECKRLDAEELAVGYGPSPMWLTAKAREALAVCDGLESGGDDPFRHAVRELRALFGPEPRPDPFFEREMAEPDPNAPDGPEPDVSGNATNQGGYTLSSHPPAPPLPHELVTALADDERARDPSFLRVAMYGAIMGWQARHNHPTLVTFLARHAAPLEEPDRSAWLTGYRLAAGDESESPTLTDVRVAGVCRVCQCTDEDCSQCIAKTGEPCTWVEPDLCSACVDATVARIDTRTMADKLGVEKWTRIQYEGRTILALQRAIPRDRSRLMQPGFYQLYCKAGLLARFADDQLSDRPNRDAESLPFDELESEAWMFGYRFLDEKEVKP